MNIDMSNEQAQRCREEAFAGTLRYGRSDLGHYFLDADDEGSAVKIWRAGAQDGDVTCMNDLAQYERMKGTPQGLREAWYWLTEVVSVHKRPSGTEALTGESALMRLPDDYEAGKAYFVLGLLADQLGKPECRKQYTLKASELGFPMALFTLGLSEYLAHEYAAAEKHLRAAVEKQVLSAFSILAYTSVFKAGDPRCKELSPR